jgi:hypothetical protein
MNAPEDYGSIIEQIWKAAATQPWTENTIASLLSTTRDGGLRAIADAHNGAVLAAYTKGRWHNDIAIAEPLRAALAAKQMKEVKLK